LGRLGDRGEIDTPVGADDTSLAGSQFDVAGRSLELVSGDLSDLLGERFAGACRRDTAKRNRARSPGAATGTEPVGVALVNMDPVDADIELVGNELGIGRRMALP